MKIRHKIYTSSISWLKNSYNISKNKGIIDCFYEPENINELIELIKILYNKGEYFDLIGHTSNIYFMPDYSSRIMISTRSCNKFRIEKNEIICDCGVSVRSLARQMVSLGFEGFYGLVDLPGTVAASVYGNASCYGCSINDLLNSFDMLCTDGQIRTLRKDALSLTKRSSSLKRGEIQGVIISVHLNIKKGSNEDEIKKSQIVQEKRNTTQPGPASNLGSIYKNTGKPRFLYYILIIVVRLVSLFCKVEKKTFFFKLLGAEDIMPYVYSWNRYIWKDNNAHLKFWKFHKLHKRLFTNSEFEIEIKGKY